MSIYENISKSEYPFIIAEAGVNYYDIAKKENIKLLAGAKRMIDEASGSGADAIKFQTYKAGKIAARNSPAYWDLSEEPTESQYELFKKYDKMDSEDYRELAGYCNDKDIIFMSTPFDFKSADYLRDLMPVYKISSSDITNIPFIKHIAKKGKPVFLSTGASNIEEIRRSVNAVIETGNREIGILHCVLSYPTDYEDANLNMIKHLKDEFPKFITGYSDHTRPDEEMLPLTTAYLLGAKIIEKHFTLDKTLPGNDHYHAMDPDDIRRFKKNLDKVIKLKGENFKKVLECEENSRRHARRSIVAARKIKKGEKITRQAITFKRPGTGIPPFELDNILGKTVSVTVDEDTIIKEEFIE